MRTTAIEKTNQLIIDYLKVVLGHRLLYVGYFGSTARDNQTILSDIDYLVIARDLPESPLVRDRLSREIKQTLHGTYPLIAFNFYTPQEIAQIHKDRPWFNIPVINELRDLYDPLKMINKIRSKKTSLLQVDPIYRSLSIKSQKISHRVRQEEHKFLLMRSHQAWRACQKLLHSRTILKTEVVTCLYRSLSSLLRAILINQGTYILKGEVVQFFTNYCSNQLDSDITQQLLSTGLKIEQLAGRCNGLSLDFSDRGQTIMDISKHLNSKEFQEITKDYRKLRNQLLKLNQKN